MPASCPNHGLTAEDHCTEMEDMLQQVPGDFCEGDGDSPADAVGRMRAAYDGYESALQRIATWGPVDSPADGRALRDIARDALGRRPTSASCCDNRRLLEASMGSKKRLTVEQRWERGLPHRKLSRAIFDELRKADAEINGNAMDLQCGGDGDNGEELMFLLDDLVDRSILSALVRGDLKTR